MPSNAELKASIDALAGELGTPTNTDGLNNGQLADALAKLRAAKAARSETPGPDAAAQAQAEADAAAQARDALMAPVQPAAAPKPPYYMAPGKAITSMVGILSGDTADEVKAEYLPGGEATLQAFVKSGHIVKS